MNVRILNRIDTQTTWESVNPILSSGEIAFVTNSVGTFMKVGDGNPYLDTKFCSNVIVNGIPSPYLSVEKITTAAYRELVLSNAVDPSILYIVDTDGSLDGWNKRIQNVADGTLSSDATNVNQLNALSSNLMEGVRVLMFEYVTGKIQELSTAVRTDMVAKQTLSAGIEAGGAITTIGDLKKAILSACV